MDTELSTIYVISGCTAVGKTELSLRWAEENDAEIVSCDSLLFYRGMDIGTAKPSTAELQRVPHHLIDIREASQAIDVAAYLGLAIETVQEIQSRGKKVLVTGGSGFYLKAFFAPVVDDVEVADFVRSEVAALYESQGLAATVEALETVSPGCREQIDAQNPRRVTRALERCRASGLTIEALKQRFESQTNPLILAEKKLVVLEREKNELNGRIALRVELMLKAGLVDEVKRLRDAGFEANLSGSRSIGYRETLDYLDKKLAEEELIGEIAANTRHLAKKQRTWFRSQLPEGKRVDVSCRGMPELDELFW